MSTSAVPGKTTQCCTDEEPKIVQKTLLSSNPATKPSKKRKYAQVESSSDLVQSHSVEILLPRLKGPNEPLIPKYIIPRSALPLSYLDPAADGEAASGPKLFSARIDYLEPEGDESQPLRPQVLLAYSRDSGRFYAIERAHSGLYAYCRLGQWVADDALKEHAQRSLAQDSWPARTAHYEEQDIPTREWWRNAIAPAHTSGQNSSLDPKAIARARDFKISLEKPSRKPLSPVPTPVAASPTAVVTIASGPSETFNDGVQKSDDSLNTIKTQYQDALYLSRAPLAYFAKGPLSRARASFQYREGTGNDYTKLTQYLRTMIFDLQVMDKKYRETLPTLIKDLPYTPMSDGEGAPIVEEIKKKSRRSKKGKVGKDGLYAGEDVSVARWWLGRDALGSARDAEDVHQQGIQAEILNLRRREAQLQIILLLETLALEGTATESTGESAGLDKIVPEQDGAPARAKKAKQPQDLNTLLDLLADRLCIWQSMNMEVGKTAATREPQGEVAQNSDDHSNSDDLRQFCVDVVIPFYGSRLPETSTLLCQKLEGPKDPSPKRSSTKMLEAKSKNLIKPGAPLPRPQPRKQRRTLERVLTFEKFGHRRAKPSLSRSATEPLIQVKREVGDLTLSSIPLNKVATSKRYAQREVDLKASSQASESKQKKKIAIERELQGAIAAIKRPDAKMAGREFVETVEKRQADSHARRAMKSGLKSTQQFQVMATPSKNKGGAPYKLPEFPQTQVADLPSEVSEVPPSSADHVVPSSTGKVPDTKSDNKTHMDRGYRNHLATLDQTPSKGPARSLVPNSQLKVPKPPIWTSGVQVTPSKTSDHKFLTHPKPIFSLQVTPCKADRPRSSPADATSPLYQVEEPDLYASLGWNYEVDD